MSGETGSVPPAERAEGAAVRPTRPAPTVSVLRPDDLLALEFELVNLSVVVEGEEAEARAVLRPRDGDAFLVLRFPPQNVAEQAFFEQVPSYPVARPAGAQTDPDAFDFIEVFGLKIPIPRPTEQLSIPARALLSGPSRLVFRVPADAGPIPLTVGGLLEACSRLELSVPPVALPPDNPRRVFVVPPWVREVLMTQADAAALSGVNAGRALMEQSKLRRWAASSGLARGASASADEVAEAFGDVARRLGLRGSLVEGILRRPGRVRFPPELLYPRLRVPAGTETAIELPFRLLVSPNRHAAWAHALDPVASKKSGRIELWHTRLATRLSDRVEEGDHRLRTIRAVWARSGPTPGERFDTTLTNKPPHSNTPFRMSLDPADRFDLVHLTSNFGIPMERRRYRPQPVNVARLMLTSLGAWVDVRGAWDPPAGTGLSVEEWRHRGTMARDHYVRVVYRGYLFPFGHRASLVKITERKFHPDRPGNPAFLRQRMFILVRQPLKTFGVPGLTTPAGVRYDNQMPFVGVRILTLVTPDLDDPAGSDYPAGNGLLQACFWPRVGGQDFRFRVVAEDLEGNDVEFTAPLLFASVDLDPAAKVPVSTSAGLLTTVRNDYEANASRSEVDIAGQRVALAPSATPGDTSFEVARLAWGAEIPDDPTLPALGPDSPRFYPRLVGADTVVPVVKQFTGTETPVRVKYADTYLSDGFGAANAGEVFLDVDPNSSLNLDFSSKGDRSGGLLQPNLAVKGLSRLLGPVSGGSDLSQITSGSFNPADFFAAMGATLFGVIDLADVVRQAGLGDLSKVPRFLTETLTALQSFLQEMQRLVGSVQALKAKVDALGAGFATLKAQMASAASSLQTDVTTLTGDLSGLLAGTTTQAQLTADLTTFRTDLQSARALVQGMPPEVPADVRQALDASLGSFLGDLADLAAFVTGLLAALQLPDELRMRFDWKPDLQSWPSSNPIFIASKDGTAASFTISAEIQAKTKVKPEPKIDIACRLQSFTLDLVAPVTFIRLKFDAVEFTMTSGQKPDVNVQFAGIEFAGVLSFVEALRSLIPLDGFSDPPALQVTEEGVQASYSLALPDIAFGVFSLQNLSIAAGFTVPFLVNPLSARFQFCERQSPCLLTVSGFGGGGFFGITIDPGGVQILEAAFEFGASVSLNFGVASGGVYVMGGIYFKIENDAAALTGYLRIGGEVEVLGIVSVSIELRMSLSYEFSSGKCVGKATLTIEIEIAFFSKSVEISVERKFAGSSGDPTFADLMGPDPADPTFRPWREYCEAFADA